ncbi:MAG: response regulator [Planctomycetota bacterium]|jgi:DNA-binding NarL/FixJ family response regulator
MIKVLIADDHQLVREGIKRILAEDDEFQVVGEASDGEETVKMADQYNPDIVLMDITMPGVDGMEATRRLMKGRIKRVRIIILTMHADEHYAARLMRMGATGYVVKDAAPEELIEAIRTVHQGRRFVSSPLRDNLALRFVEGPEDEPIDTLTDREFQVLSKLALGLTNREIADDLSVSIKTVDAHRLNLLSKLNLRNNSEITKFALQNGIIEV